MEMGVGTTVETYPHWVSDERCYDALKSCDVVFGCTDDDDGRFLLNRLAYYYLIPLFDMGLAIEPRNDVSEGFYALDARITLVTPEATCLSCRGIIDPVRASEQALRRSDPDEYARRKEEAYVIGEGNPNPAVITFTTECASMAVSEFLNMLHPFRNDGSSYTMLQRRFNLSMDLRPGHKPASGCPYCDSDERWGRGDVNPFLDRVG
jgi:molybdopterin/thiamine biosynthesis adenylyltransferase